MNNFGFDLHEYTDNLDKSTDLLQGYLNKGKLGLFLGAGVSYSLGLPGWTTLVTRCVDLLQKQNPSKKIDFDRTNFDAKKVASKFKTECDNDDQYLEIVREALYDGVKFNFGEAKKEMLIALTSLIVGKARGNVEKIITFNFDSVLEWYLEISGLRVNIMDVNPLNTMPPDVDILHLHGFLPEDKIRWTLSDKIVLTEEEFEVRESGYNYWKDVVAEWYKSHVFLTVGLSAESVCRDLVRYFNVLTEDWYKPKNIPRRHPFAVAFLTSCSADQQQKMLRAGVIPITITNHKEFPEAIFSIAQKAVSSFVE